MLFFLVLLALLGATLAEIETLQELYDTIIAGPNRKVGFLTQGNYQAVRNTLPSTVEPVYVTGGVAIMTEMVSNGTLLAGLVTQVPPHGFNQFPSGIISPQSMMIATNASSLLRQTIDAAIVRVLSTGGPFQYARDNPPIVVMEANSCSPNGDAYPFPSAQELAGEAWFGAGKMRIGSLGPVNWGNTGDYTVDPPVGFWPDYLAGIEAQLVAQYGASGFTGFERVFFSTSDALLTSVKSGNVDMSEPYFVVEGLYRGRGRSSQFSQSCFTYASSSTYFTKRDEAATEPELTAGAVAGVVIGGVLLVASALLLLYMVYKERKGQPLFTPLRSDDEDEVTVVVAGARFPAAGAGQLVEGRGNESAAV